LNIANAYGWEILCPAGFKARWNGGTAKGAVSVEPDPGATAPALGHFGHGILTFHVPCLFETDPGVDLFVTGPLNRPKDAIAPLTGVIETDWAPYSFTMNWQFTRADFTIRFNKGEPFCHVFPIAREALEAVEPRLHRLSEAPDLERRHKQWAQARGNFNTELLRPGSQAAEQRWQKMYFRGREPTGEPGRVEGHRNRLRLKPFTGAK
jgi:hypothetical protein